MKKCTSQFCVGLVLVLSLRTAFAQLSSGYILLPTNPTSAESIKLSMKDGSCGGNVPYVGNAYRVSMSQNSITVAIGERVSGRVNPGICPPAGAMEEFDLGRLPAGNYTLSVIEPATQSIPSRVVITNAPFTVTDARATKVAPYVRLDYSGHWWDPNDSGWGLFIWHDARDAMLAAWFTYTPDGKPMWYVFQPRFETSAATFTTDLLQTSRLPGATSPPPTATTYVVAGSASLDFTNFGTGDEGKLTYTFTGGAKLVRNIQRFKP